MIADQYDVFFISFKRKGENAYNMVRADGANVEAWHLHTLEKWLAAQRAKELDGSDLV